MLLNGHKLSAVARRRLLQGTGSTASSSTTPSSPEATAEAKITESNLQKSPANNRDEESEGDEIGTANQFSTLVEASVVDFTPSREVEQLARGSVRIRLSRGQKCVILGSCSLWVKQGSVSIYGAVLSVSTTTYRVYAPSTHALPAIQATTPDVHLELENLNDGAKALSALGLRGMWNAGGEKESDSSFQVLGHSFELDAKAPRRFKELDISPWKSLLNEISDFPLNSPPRILIRGRRSSGLSTLVRCMINRFLSKQLAASNDATEPGVMVLDLDTNLPEFAPPGMISLAHVKRPIFGPPFTNLLSSSPTISGQLSRAHFLGEIDRNDLEEWHIPFFYDLLDLQKNCRQNHQDRPEIVILPGWLSDIDQNIASSIWSKILPSHVVCLDPSPTSPLLERWQPLAENGGCRVYQLPVQVFDKITAVQEHDLQMQSYFHREQFGTNRPLWNESPLLANGGRMLRLSYEGDDSPIYTIILLGGHVALEDTYDAIHGSLVALVAVQGTTFLGQEDGPVESSDIVEEYGHFSAGKIWRTDEDLPRWQGQAGLQSSMPFSAESSNCLGLAQVQETDIPNRTISFITGPELHVPDLQETGCRVALVICKATADGRFGTDWVQREMGVKKSPRPWD